MKNEIEMSLVEPRSPLAYNQAMLESKVWIGQNILSRVRELPVLGNGWAGSRKKKGFILADAKLKKYAQLLKQNLEKENWKVHVFYLEASEKLKSLRSVYPLYGKLLEAGADRSSMIFALGGGVIGDVAGFIAGTYMRGIPWVGVPTTLLAMVDSSIGGKTGVNHEKGKNLIGVIHQPARVICQTSFLNSLPMRERVSGLGEIVKYGLILDPDFFRYLRQNWEKILLLEELPLETAIQKCVDWKTQIVQQDERETRGIRETLNFGHTLGHAIEAQANYQLYRHGEAVILGMRAAAYLSVLRGHLAESTFEEVDGFLGELPVPPLFSRIKAKDLIARLKFDKKARDGNARFVLLKGIGETLVGQEVLKSEIEEAVEWLKQ